MLERDIFNYSFGFDARPTPTNFTWSRDGQVISSDDARIATSFSSITITSTTRSDSGVYEVVSYNEAGKGAANFTLDVQCELSFYAMQSHNYFVCMICRHVAYLHVQSYSTIDCLLPTDPPQFPSPLSPALLTTGTLFSFNCTPIAANPPVDSVSIQVDGSPVTSGDTVTVTDNVLTIPSVQRSHSGNYSCTATNTVGSAVTYRYLLVTDGGEYIGLQASWRHIVVKMCMCECYRLMNLCPNIMYCRCSASLWLYGLLQFLSLQELLFSL